MLELDISDISSHQEKARQLLSFAGHENVFLFDAPMGSGKTTFIKSLCRVLGVDEAISSPTYSIVNEYKTNGGRSIFHFDLYRLKSENELYDFGFEEYLEKRAFVFIEWPELALPFLEHFMRIVMKTEGNNRYISAEKK